MKTTSTLDPFQRTLANALLAFPSIFVLVFILHFRRFGDFFHFRTHYVPAPPERVVPALIAAHNRWPLVHDAHMIAYIALPIIPLCAFALYLLGRRARPVASAISMMVTISGVIYMGGVFGMWTAFYRGLGRVDPANVAGAIATFAAMTSPQDAFLVTTTLAKLTMIGLALQSLVLAGKQIVPTWAIVSVVLGCLLFLLFWDLDNWMLIGSLLLAAGFYAMRQALLKQPE